MAYEKKKLYSQAIDVIERNNLFFIEDIVAFLPCDKTTFYKYFPPNSLELDNLKSKLDTNKIRTKSAIRAKLYKGTKASELIALYKLICTDDERRALQMNYVENKHILEENRKTIDDLFPFDDEICQER
jgi:hypothetical protein